MISDFIKGDKEKRKSKKPLKKRRTYPSRSIVNQGFKYS